MAVSAEESAICATFTSQRRGMSFARSSFSVSRSCDLDKDSNPTEPSASKHDCAQPTHRPKDLASAHSAGVSQKSASDHTIGVRLLVA